MKKYFALLVSLCLFLTLVACGQPTVSVSDAEEQGDVTTVGKVTETNSTTKGQAVDEDGEEDEEDEEDEVTDGTGNTKKTRKTTTKKPKKTTAPAGDGVNVHAVKQLYTDGKLRMNGRLYASDAGLVSEYSDDGIVLSGELEDTVAVDLVVSTGACYFNIVVDGDADDVKTVRLNAGAHTLYAVTGLKKGKHTVEISRGTKYSTTVTFKTLYYTGTLERPAKPALQLEFVGDSVTCSEGSIKEGEYSVDGHNSFYGYAAMTARALKAGIAVEAICGAYTASMCDRFNDSYWDFSNNPKDIVIINLGTNDVGWPGKGVPDTFPADVKNTIAAVREKYGKNTYIVWAYGMMFDNNKAAIKQAVEQYATEKNDSSVLFCDMSSVKNTDGYGSHPSQEGHAKAATFLTNWLKANCGA